MDECLENNQKKEEDSQLCQSNRIINKDMPRKVSEREKISEINYKKVKFYKNQKEEITFRLVNHQEYFITGKIIRIKKEKDFTYDFLIQLKLKGGSKVCYTSRDIDFETICPANYNPIRYFLREPISKNIKEEVFKRDEYKCKLKLIGCTEVATEIDHLIPISQGGLNVIDNLQSSCSSCYKKKRDNILI